MPLTSKGMSVPEITVVVPVYNVQAYLPKCIDSLLAQTFGEIEIILVDDGSTDDTWAIVEERAQRDGRVAALSFEQLMQLEHAWAMTVHKSQGSEYRAVVLALAQAAPRLLTRGVLYTAVTRARELLIAVGGEETAHRMIDNHVQSRRYSGLRLRLSSEK